MNAVVPVPLAINQIQQGGAKLTFRYKNDEMMDQRCALLTSNLFYAPFFKKTPEGLAFSTVTETKKLKTTPDGGRGR